MVAESVVHIIQDCLHFTAKVSTLRSSSLEPEPLIPMARVSRTAAAKSQRHGSGDSGATVRSDNDTVDLYLSINSLRSIQAQEEGNRRSFKELCMSGELKKCFCIESSEDESRVCVYAANLDRTQWVFLVNFSCCIVPSKARNYPVLNYLLLFTKNILVLHPC